MAGKLSAYKMKIAGMINEALSKGDNKMVDALGRLSML